MKHLKKEVEKKYEVNEYTRDSLFAELKQFCTFSIGKNGDYIEITE